MNDQVSKEVLLVEYLKCPDCKRFCGRTEIHNGVKYKCMIHPGVRWHEETHEGVEHDTLGNTYEQPGYAEQDYD